MNTVDNIHPVDPNPNRTAISRDLPVREVLEDEARKALLFLKAVARHPALRAQLADAGYTQAEHEEGFRLFFVAHGHGTRPGDAPMAAASQALDEIESWQATGFARAAAVLVRKHREAWRLVFGDGLSAERGRASITALVTFLDRLDRLEGTNAEALATLAARGIDAKVREHLRSLVEVATAKADGMLTLDNAAQQKRLTALIQLFRWYSEWELTARLVVASHADLVRLGIAKPRATKTKTAKPKPAAPSPTPVRPAAPAPAHLAHVPSFLGFCDNDEAPPSRAA